MLTDVMLVICSFLIFLDVNRDVQSHIDVPVMFVLFGNS